MAFGDDASASTPGCLFLCLSLDDPLDLPEYPLPVEDVGYDHPQRSGNEVLGQVFTMGLCIPHLPLKWEVVLKYFMANVDKN